MLGNQLNFNFATARFYTIAATSRKRIQRHNRLTYSTGNRLLEFDHHKERLDIQVQPSYLSTAASSPNFHFILTIRPLSLQLNHPLISQTWHQPFHRPQHQTASFSRFKSTMWRRSGPSKATSTNVQCQKCLKRDTYFSFHRNYFHFPHLTLTARHYSYECKASAQERPYIPRPSRTQQLFNPKLQPKLTNAVPDDIEKK